MSAAYRPKHVSPLPASTALPAMSKLTLPLSVGRYEARHRSDFCCFCPECGLCATCLVCECDVRTGNMASEQGLSDCRYGCKVYAYPSGRVSVTHASVYGCHMPNLSPDYLARWRDVQATRACLA